MPSRHRTPREVSRYVDRATGQVVAETRADGDLLAFLYGRGPGSWFLRRLARRRIVSKIIALHFDWPASPKRLRRFIDQWGIDVDEAERPWEEYRTQNELFSRRLQPDARPIDTHPEALISPADGCLLVFPGFDGRQIPVKGGHFPLDELVRDQALAERYHGGDLALFRLSPPDYHRFHFPADGVAEPAVRIEGLLDSVSPDAQIRDPALFCTNRRDRVLFHSDRFGELLLLSIGAMAIGGVVQTYTPGRVHRGEEQGYFCYGGSAIVLALEPGRIRFDGDLVASSQKGLETRVKMGERIAWQSATDAMRTTDGSPT